jgi:hypothetical protein
MFSACERQYSRLLSPVQYYETPAQQTTAGICSLLNAGVPAAEREIGHGATRTFYALSHPRIAALPQLDYLVLSLHI